LKDNKKAFKSEI